MRCPQKKAYVNYVGCEKRKLDAEKLARFLEENGYQIVPKVEDADVVAYVTCAFNSRFENISLQNIRDLNDRKKKGSKFIVAGCLTSINPQTLEPFSIDLQVSVRHNESLDFFFKDEMRSARIVPYEKISDPNCTRFEVQDYDTKKVREDRSQAHDEYERAKLGYKVRLNYGCTLDCSYCVTKFATEKLKSKSLERVLEECRNGITSGHNTLFLTGGDSGAYGIDIGTSVVELLREVLCMPEPFKVYMHDFGVHWLIKHLDYLLPIFSAHSEKLGCFNFPIQSGSNRILKLMRRPYTSEKVVDALEKLRSTVSSIKIGTHIMTGFPSEAEADHNKTLQLVQNVDFDFAMVFPYSDNPLADSHNLEGQVPRKIKERRRLEILNALKSRSRNSLNIRRNSNKIQTRR